MINYKSDYISTFSEIEYKKALNDIDILNNISYQYNNRYDDNTTIEATTMLFKESLDHYILKQLTTNPSFLNSKEMETYVKYIINIYNNNITEFNTNIVFINEDIRKKIISKYIPEKKDLIEQNYKKVNDKWDNIIIKINNNQKIRQDELDYVTECMSNIKLEELKEEHTILIKFIYGKMKNTELIFSKKVQDYIVSIFPFYYAKCNNNASLKNIRYVFSNTDNYRPIKGPGHSSGKKNYIALNREFFKNIDNKSIEDSKVERLKSGKDITFFTIVCFHEITHQLQRNKSKISFIDNNGLSNIIHTITNQELKDYKYNHDSDSIEIDANKIGWETCESFYCEYYSGKEKEQLLSNCYKNSKTSMHRRLFAYKKNNNNEYIPQEEYDINQLCKIIKKSPNYLEEYKMLKCFFSKNGDLKPSLLLNYDLYTEDNCMEFVNHFFRTNGIEKMIEYINKTKLDKTDITHLLNNIYNYISNKINAYKKLEYTINHKNSGEYNNNEEFSEEVARKLSKKHHNDALSSYKKSIPLLKLINDKYPEQTNYINFIIETLNKDLTIYLNKMSNNDKKK